VLAKAGASSLQLRDHITHLNIVSGLVVQKKGRKNAEMRETVLTGKKTLAPHGGGADIGQCYLGEKYGKQKKKNTVKEIGGKMKEEEEMADEKVK
jgi:hypothetical protein